MIVGTIGILYIGVQVTLGTQMGKLPFAPSLNEILTYGFAVLALVVALAALIVTAAGVMVGVAAILGYQGLKQEAQIHAREAAKSSADEYFRGKEFEDKIKSGIGLTSWKSGTTTGIEEPISPIAKTYPKRRRAANEPDKP